VLRFGRMRGQGTDAGSLTLQHDVANLIIERQAKHGQYAIVYFASDHDPSGLCPEMRSIARARLGSRTCAMVSAMRLNTATAPKSSGIEVKEKTR
jgi:hypothetical protein